MRLQMLHQTVFSSYLYGCEVLTLRRTETLKVQSFETTLYRKLFSDFTSEREVIQQKVEDLLPNHLWLCQRIRQRRLGFVGHVLRGQSLCKQIHMSTNFTQQRGRSKSFLKQIADELVRVKQITGTITIAETIHDRNQYRTACVQHIRELGELGRHRCPFEGCRKEYITDVPYFKHLQRHYEAEFSTTTTTPIDPTSNVPTEPILQSDPLAPLGPRRSARQEAQRVRQLQQANLTVD